MQQNIRKESSDSRQRLLEAARHCFLKQPYSKVSTRQIADLAEVNKALINYYFQSKQGLFETMILDIVNPAFRKLEKAGQGQPQSLVEIMMTMAKVIDDNPDFPKLMTQIIFNQDHPAQEHVIVRFLIPALTDFKLLLKQMLGPNADKKLIEHTLISIYSLLIGPALLQPILGQVLDSPLQSNFLEQQTKFNVSKIEKLIPSCTKKA